MKADIHPRYEDITARCSCGNEIKTRSTLSKDITIDVCSRCHPFFTGKQKIVDSGGRVDRFNKRFAGRGLKKQFVCECLRTPAQAGVFCCVLTVGATLPKKAHQGPQYPRHWFVPADSMG